MRFLPRLRMFGFGRTFRSLCSPGSRCGTRGRSRFLRLWFRRRFPSRRVSFGLAWRDVVIFHDHLVVRGLRGIFRWAILSRFGLHRNGRFLRLRHREGLGSERSRRVGFEITLNFRAAGGTFIRRSRRDETAAPANPPQRNGTRSPRRVFCRVKSFVDRNFVGGSVVVNSGFFELIEHRNEAFRRDLDRAFDFVPSDIEIFMSDQLGLQKLLVQVLQPPSG